MTIMTFAILYENSKISFEIPLCAACLYQYVMHRLTLLLYNRNEEIRYAKKTVSTIKSSSMSRVLDQIVVT